MPEAAQSEPLAAMLQEVYQLRRPTVAPNTGAPLEQIAQILQQEATEAAKTKRWDLVADYQEEILELHLDDDEQSLAMWAYALAQMGRTDEAAHRLDQQLAERPENGQLNYARAMLAARQEDVDTAAACLEMAIRSGFITAARVNEDGFLEALRGDPRIEALLGPQRPTTSVSRPSE
jgi:tetratricopeptide (TPR) repeat protein